MSSEIELTPTQRAAAVDRARENIALHSGAGCGKTFVLAHRLTELLMSETGDDPLSRFVALTFTDKAAIEMLQRVRKLLRDFAANTHSQTDRRRLLGWLQQLSDARVCTIHSFCAALLRGNAIEAGIDPDFVVCPDELIVSQMVEHAADEAVLAAVEADDAGAAETLALLPYRRVAEDVRRLLDMRTAWNPADYADPAATLARWEALRQAQAAKAWEELESNATFRRQLDELMGEPCDDDGDKLALYRTEQCELIRKLLDNPASRSRATMAMLETAPRNIGTKKAWSDKERARTILRRVKDLVSQVAELADFCDSLGELDEQAARLLATLTRLAVDANARYTAEKRRRGLLDFTDLLATADRLLRQSPAVRQALSEGISQLLVDEAQDTDGFQVALLERLIFGEAGGEHLPAGRLFLVGDAKQSIYRFRGAEVEVFRDLCRRIGPSRQENLDRSFRTHAAGVAFVNHLFSRLMGSEYEPIHAHRSDAPQRESVEVMLAQPHGKEESFASADDASAAQAAVTAQRIAEMVAAGERRVRDEGGGWRPVRYGDVAILFSRMTNSLEYERQLARRGVPYYVVAGTGFFRQQEVFDVLGALRAIENPFDDIATMGVLRSGLIGLDDNALMHLAEAMDPPYLPTLFEILDAPGTGQGEDAPPLPIPGLNDEQARRMGFAVNLLRRLGRKKDAMSVDELIERLLAETGYEATLAAGFQGAQQLGNVRRLVDRARTAAAAGTTLAEFVAQTGELVLTQSRYEQAAVAGEEQDVVRLMTIHKAKGLEFPVVFIPDLNTARHGVTNAMIHRRDWLLTYKLKAEDNDKSNEDSSSAAADETPLSYRLARRREQVDSDAEDIRLLYVAATRHEDHLVFVAADWRTKDGELRQRGSYARMLDEHLGVTAVADGDIQYGESYRAAVRKVRPVPPPAQHHQASPGEKLLAAADSGDELAAGLASLACDVAETASLIGPLPAEVGGADLAITAMVDFEHCPMLYRWRHELRLPRNDRPAAERSRENSEPTGPIQPTTLDAATLGTLYHRCMELLDVARPQPAAHLARQAAAELDLSDTANLDTLAAELETMLAAFARHPLHAQLAGARQSYRELDFVLDVGPATLRGQIDLLYQDADGAWRIVDYKSDHVSQTDAPKRAQRYELQMLLYAAAVEAHTGTVPGEATLYFLRPALACPVKIDADALTAARERAQALARRLVTARRDGVFARNEGGQCEYCMYADLCRQQVHVS